MAKRTIIGKTHILGQELDKLRDGEISKIKLNSKDLKNSLPKIKEKLADKKLALVFGTNRYYFLNDRTMSNLMNGQIDENAVVTYGEEGSYETRGSDSDWVTIAGFSQSIELVEIKSRVKHPTKSIPAGAYFKYLNNTNFDFSKYGVFKYEERNYEDNCFVMAMIGGGMEDEKLNAIRIECRNRIIPRIQIKNKICPDHNIVISVKTMRNSKDRGDIEYFGTASKNTPPNEDDEYYNLGLIDEHYFLIEKTEVTRYALENYEDIKELPNCNKFIGYYNGSYKPANNRFIDSYDVIKILLEKKDTLLEPMPYDDTIMKSPFYDKVTHFKTLEYPTSCLKDEVYQPKEMSKHYKKYYKVYFDFETITTQKHEPYLVCYETEDGEKAVFFNAIDMLNNLPDKENIMLIAHNANYDCRFILNYLKRTIPIIKSGRFISIDAEYWRYNDKTQKINIRIKDSYKMIDFALSKFGEAFTLKQSKEIMPYGIYTNINIQKRFVKIEEAMKFIKDKEDQEQFKRNINEWGLRCNTDCYDIVKYSIIYCQLDCTVLKLGYEKFREWMIRDAGLDVDNYCTIQSLAQDFALKEGCYEGVLKIGGLPQCYMSNCVVGGRVMCNSNKIYHIKGELADFDCTSQYPSSMKRLGFLKGSPKILQSNQLNKEFLDDVDGYFIRIRILEVGTKREFPLLSRIDDYGVRLFTNDMENNIIYIDRYGLEDAIRFQKVKYEILDGYYYNEGRQDNISNVIQKLFKTRKAYKDEKDEEGNDKPNPAEKVIKLLMNSVYGKTIMKPIDSDTKVVPDFDFERYTLRHYNYIKDSIKVGNHHYIKVIKSVDKHFNYVHCGVEVLSMSKRIMNEVMCLAEDNNLKIFYQDTDSMHIIYDQVEILAKLFKETEGRNLIGEELGEFHIDFDICDEKGNKVKGVKNIKAIESYFIGKKTYFDTLRGAKDGKYVVGCWW